MLEQRRAGGSRLIRLRRYAERPSPSFARSACHRTETFLSARGQAVCRVRRATRHARDVTAFSPFRAVSRKDPRFPRRSFPRRGAQQKPRGRNPEAHSSSDRGPLALPFAPLFAPDVADRRERKIDDLGLIAIGPISLPVDSRSLAPQTPQGFVHGDAGYPGAERCVAAEGLKTRKRPDVGFLHHVFGFGIIAHDAPRNAKQSPIVPERDSSDRGFVTLAREPHQILVVQFFGNRALSPGDSHVSHPFWWIGCLGGEKVPAGQSVKTIPPARRPSWRAQGDGPWRQPVSEPAQVRLRNSARPIAHDHSPSD